MGKDSDGSTGLDVLSNFLDELIEHGDTRRLFFCYQINLRKSSGHYGMGTHTKTIIWIQNACSIAVDYCMSGVDVTVWDWSSNPFRTTKPEKVSYELWVHEINKRDLVTALQDVVNKVFKPPKWNLVALVPGKTFGQNCTTFAVKLGRKAGYNFLGERIYGTNPKALSKELHRRWLLTDWNVLYR